MCTDSQSQPNDGRIHGASLSEKLRQDLETLQQSSLDAVDPYAAVRRYLHRDRDKLRIGEMTWSPSAAPVGRVLIIAVGKAAVPMASAAAGVLGEWLSGGVVVTKYGHVTGWDLPQTLAVIEAGHPIPDPAGLQGGQAIIELLQTTTAHDLVLVCLSGGGSALVPAPVEGLGLEDLQSTTTLLLRAGATIVEVNAVRKHLSRLKGGQLARLAAPAHVASLILSDVVGDPLDVIASGPTSPDPTTYGEALEVLTVYDLLEQVPPDVLAHLRSGAAPGNLETPKPGDEVFCCVTNVIVGSNRLAAQAVVARAKALGYNSLLLTTFVEGEAREIAKVAVALAKGVRLHNNPVPPPACLVWGGETTVTVRGTGMGGRNQELALSAALGLQGMKNLALLALATDGTDGPTDAAGAIVDGDTIPRALALGRDPRAVLRNNDSYSLLDSVGDLLRTGPTGTNVNDLLILLVV